MSKINAAESIRGLACLAVVLSHLIFTFFPLLHTNSAEDIKKLSTIESLIYHSPLPFLYSGSAAVFIFFVLSGFVLSHAILSKKDVNQKILSMSIKRYPRLAIPALISCIIAYFIFFIEVDRSNVSEWIAGYGSENFGFIDSIYQGLIGSFVFGSAPLNIVLWTMQVELFGSFIVFFLLYSLLKSKYYFFILSLIFPVLCSSVSMNFAAGIGSFVIGVYIYLYGNKIPKLFTLPALIIGFYFAGVHNFSDSYSLFYSFFGVSTYTILTMLSGPLIVFGILMNRNIAHIADKKILVILGKLSFSIYLLHLIVIYILGVPFFNLLLSFNLSYFVAALISSLVVIISTIFLSYFYSHYVDDLAISFSTKLENIFRKRINKAFTWKASL